MDEPSKLPVPERAVMTVADALADIRRVGFRYHVFTLLGVGTYFAARMALGDPALSGFARTVWTLMPWPFLAWGVWGWSARSGRDELGVSVDREASTIAWRFTVLWLLVLSLLDAGGDQPFRWPTGGQVEWTDIMIWPLLVYALAWVRARRRVLPTG